MRLSITRLALALSVARSAVAGAQAPAPATAGDRSVGVWVGAAFDSPAGDYLGATPGRNHFLLGLRAEWVLEALGPVAIASTADLIPAAVVTGTPVYRVRHLVAPSGSEFEVKEVTGDAPVYGFGLSPFGLKLSAAASRHLRLFAAGAVGALWFTRDTPVPNSRRLNVTFEYGGGVDVVRWGSRSWVLGYKFHHLSNAFSAVQNPGLDGHVFYVGLLQRR